jgi:ABC-type phosphate transport system substrate-binding protein
MIGSSMKRYRAYLIAFAIPALVALVSTTTAAEQELEVAVIVNPENPVTSISSADLRRVFVGDKQSWSSTLPVFAVVRAPEARERHVLLTQVLKMTEPEYKQYWLRRVYSGESPQEPMAVYSNGMQLEAVRVKKGGIALISVQDVRAGVKIIKVDGYVPGTPGYPFR